MYILEKDDIDTTTAAHKSCVSSFMLHVKYYDVINNLVPIY